MHRSTKNYLESLLKIGQRLMRRSKLIIQLNLRFRDRQLGKIEH